MNTPPFRRAGLLSRSVPLVYGTDIRFLAIEGFIIGLFAPTIRRHGPTHEFRDAVDAANQAGPGVILDWVQGHFLSDAHGLGQFSGTAHYEHADPREGYHPGRLAPGRGGFHAVSRSLAQGG